MANTKGVPNIRNAGCSGKQSFLPPKSPLPSISHAYGDYGSNPCMGSKNMPRPKEGNIHHHRTSSGSFLIEEQPSWLDDLLNEPETPVRRGAHRRSSSDSSAYLDLSGIYLEKTGQEGHELRNLALVPSWGSRELNRQKEIQHSSYCVEGNSVGRTQSREWEFGLSDMNYPSSNLSTKEKVVLQSPGTKGDCSEPESVTSTANVKNGEEDSAPQDCERGEGSYGNYLQSEQDPKRAKQKFAQRSRVRKLQYIAELERNVQALQAEISKVCAEVEFLDQQTIILSLENKALKRRLDSLTQEQVLKCVQQEMLEREISRLGAIYQQQHRHHQQPQPPPHPVATHGRTSSRDLVSLFDSLSLKHRRPILDRNQ
ncbi:unnamed protein product [Spirodela intermedia]|uniref:BZIP domain-containing protein n=1 Tax=Spirodela intermedia TaxID=51605 RepID=A0A7I8KFJ6_SPIIN|nr:unnamed protein product [Spirodela intermedia]